MNNHAILTIFGISEMTTTERKWLIKWLESQIETIKENYKTPGFSKRYRARLLK